MLDFQNYSFLWALAFGGLFAIIYAIRALIGYRQVAQDAKSDYEFKKREGMVPSKIRQDLYLRAYKRTYAPRAPAYVAGGLMAIALLTGPAIRLLHIIFEKFWILTGRDIVFEPGFLVWKFMIFFGLIAIWATIVYIFARFYHRGAPFSFEQELESELQR